MRILELQLIAYGPFAGARLDFSDRPNALHIVYGPNEAGKTTALRALSALLYGVPRDTRDDHFHKKSELRIGGRLSAGGADIEIVRRKGLRDTLLDANGAPIDDLPLRRMLGGVSEELFRTMFGLDHEALRRGAQAILEGGGDVGESLFGAAMGGAALRETLERLRADAEQLFTPQAHKRPINEALRAFAEAQRASRQPTTEAAWTEQQKRLDEAVARQSELEQQRRVLRSQQTRLRRARMLLPLLGERRALSQRRTELGDVRLLGPTAADDRHRAERERAEAAARAGEIEEAIASLEQERAPLEERTALAAFALSPQDLERRLATYAAAMRESEAARTELAAAEHAAVIVTRRLGALAPRAEAPARIDPGMEARVKTLAIERATLDANARHAEQAIAEAEIDLAACNRRIDAIVPGPSLAALESLVTGTPAGELEARRRQLEADRERIARLATTRLAGLGLRATPLGEALHLPVPDASAIERAEQGSTAIERERARVATELEAAERAAEAARRELEALTAAGAPPSEMDLKAIRATRDAAWDELRRAIDGRARDVAARVRALDASMREADAIADRLRREADRVAQLARLSADRASHDRERARLEARASAIAEAADAANAEWAALWAPVGIEPRPPSEMRAWIAKHAAMMEQLEALARIERELASVRDAAEALREELVAALASAGEAAAAGSLDLAALVARASGLLRDAAERMRARRELEARRDELERNLDAATRQRSAAVQALASWSAEWTRLVRPLGLDDDATLEAVSAVVDGHLELVRATERADALRARADRAGAELRGFAAHVRDLGSRLAPDLPQDDVVSLARTLLTRYAESQAARDRRAHIEQQLERERRLAAEQRQRAARAQAEIDQLMAAAGAVDGASLEAAERRSAEARRLDARIEELELQLVHVGGTSVAALEAELADLAGTDVDPELEAVDERLETLDRDIDRTHREIGGIEAGFADLESRSTAANAAAEAQQHLARLRAHVDRYMTVRLAALVLEREIERYRERNQAPLVARAGALLARLTLGSFTGLRATYDDADQPRLACVRANGREVDVAGLSDGTRDQLYLALRLATLEARAELAETLPLVADDVFIHFDDERARAGLAVLGDLAARVQIVFFTHHARLVDLAREAVAPERLAIHRLAAAAEAQPIAAAP